MGILLCEWGMIGPDHINKGENALKSLFSGRVDGVRIATSITVFTARIVCVNVTMPACA